MQSRHYSTGGSRWNTRDLLWPREPAFTYVNCNPVTLIDPEGLQYWDTSVPPQRHGTSGYWDTYVPVATVKRIFCDDECRKYGNSNQTTDWGVVLCIGNTKCPCYIGPPGEPMAVQDCVRAHEKDHFDDVPCPYPGNIRPPFKNKNRRLPGECHAYEVQVKCSAGNCGSNAECNHVKCFACDQIQNFCKKAGIQPPPDIVGICKGCGVVL